MRDPFIIFLILLSFSSCKQEKKEETYRLVTEWKGKEIIFPDNLVFMLWGRDTVQYSIPQSKYKIVSYIDSIGCISCKLQLPMWKILASDLHSAFSNNVPILLFFYQKKGIEGISFLLKRDKFNYPVCIDINDSFNKLNHFPDNPAFQTFLLDEDNRIVAMGNPVHNHKVKELYMNIIQGKVIVPDAGNESVKTKVEVKEQNVTFGKIDWKREQKVEFILKNMGDNLLVIDDVATSCGCISVDYSKEPVQPNKTVTLQVIYKAGRPEHFSKTLSVYCNAESSPIVLGIVGDAK